MTSNFDGPIFVVGMPRSGTKLLRNLLNNHNDIYIPLHESKIIPYLVNKYGYKIPCDQIDKVITEWYESIFYKRIAKDGIEVEKELWLQNIEKTEEILLAHIFEIFFKILSKRADAKIWGEKTPTYLLHYTLLMEMYPSALFIHIVRDVRDYCLSINKAWGKSMLRASQRWNQSLHEFYNQINRDNVFHVRYENLIADPEKTLSEVCAFIGIPYSSEMVKLSESPENLGDAKGFKVIKKDNSLKWKERLSKRKVYKIEKTSSDMMEQFGYKTRYYSGKSIKLSVFKQLIFKLSDGLHLLKFQIKRIGNFSEAVRFLIREYKRRV